MISTLERSRKQVVKGVTMQWRISYRLDGRREFEIVAAESHKAAVRDLLSRSPHAEVLRVRGAKSNRTPEPPLKVRRKGDTGDESTRSRINSRPLRLKRRGKGMHRVTTKPLPRKVARS